MRSKFYVVLKITNPDGSYRKPGTSFETFDEFLAYIRENVTKPNVAVEQASMQSRVDITDLVKELLLEIL